jgi:hypothetical protein
MRVKHHELEIPEDNPFANCQLEREKYASILTEIINLFPDGFVLAINNDWGTGKTTFIKMWEKYLKNRKFQTLYFNAWENDFDENPLVALMAELKTLIKSNVTKQKIFNSVIEKGAVIAKNALPAIAKGVLKRYVDIEALTEGAEGVVEDIAAKLQERIKEYTQKKESIDSFRKELEKFIKESTDDKPLIFVIDELDRCRPDYAVELLEQMKHFFSVPGIVFVLSIDKNHLSSSVKGYYGSENIDTDEYLRRFIDLEYSIPRPSTKEFVRYLYDYYEFKHFLGTPSRMQISEFRNDSSDLLKMAELLFEKSNTTLRQQEKIFAHARLTLLLFEEREYTFSFLLFILIYIKALYNDLYTKIESKDLTPQQLSDAFCNLFGENIDREEFYGINLGYVEALFLHLYCNRSRQNPRQLLYTIEGNEVKLHIVSKLNSENQSFIQIIKDIISRWGFEQKNINYLLNKINLTEPIKTI